MKAKALFLAALLAPLAAGAADSSGGRGIAVSGMHYAGGVLASVDLSLEPVFCATGQVFAAYAAADAGADLADWPHVVKVADATERDASVSCPLAAEWGEAEYQAVRFFLVSSVLRYGDYAARLEYVESSASSYIDTGVKTTEKSRVESRFMRITDDVQVSLYGSGAQTLTAWIGANSGLSWRFNTTAVTPNPTTKNVWYDFEQSTNGVVMTVAGGATTTNRYPKVSAFTSSANLNVFRNGTDGSWTRSVRMAYFRHYTNDVLATSLVPCKLGDGTAAVCNAVTGETITPAGLSAGPEVAPAGATNTTASAIEYEALGASELSPSVAVDTSRQRTIGFSGTLSTVGNPPTTVLLQYGGGTKASAVAAEDGAWSLVWDASADVAWTSAAVPYTLVCSNALGSTVWTSQVEGTFSLADNAAYTWTGAGETANWSDAGNWSASLADCAGAPVLGGDAVFTDGTVADIVLDVDARLGNYAVGASDVAVSLTAAVARAFTVATGFLVADPNDATVRGSTFVFDGPIALDAPFVSTGKGNLLRFANGVTHNSQRTVQLAVQNSAVPYEGTWEILSGSSANIDSLYINGNAEVVVDDAELYAAYCVINCWAPGGTIRIAGRSPTFRSGSIRSGSNVANCTGRLLFSIPVGGYVARSQNVPAPFGYASGGSSFGGNEPIRWELDRDSPAFKTGRSRGSTLLCYSRSPQAIDTTYHTFVRLPTLRTCDYTIDNASNPKTVSVAWEYCAATVIVVK